MDVNKKAIRDACKRANSYHAWRNPFGVWFVTLFNEKDEAFFEFQYSDGFSSRDKQWVSDLFEKIRSKKKEVEENGNINK